jgi:F-type H+-transporting ATPase subunit a
LAKTNKTLINFYQPFSFPMSQSTIAVASETIQKFSFGQYHFNLTNTMFTTLIVCSFLILIAIILGRLIPKATTIKIGKFQSFLEIIGQNLEGFITGISGSKQASTLTFSLVGFFFGFITLSSWSGLLPGFGQLLINTANESVHVLRAPTTDLNATIALSSIAFVLIQAQGLLTLKFGYVAKFLNFSSGMNFFVGILELISEVSRLLSFSFRLFGNIFAGEVMLAIIAGMSLGTFLGVPVGLPFPSLVIALEFMVALIQAYVFCSLFLVFSNLAKEKAH